MLPDRANFKRYACSFIIIILTALTCDPMLNNLFWLCDGEIGTASTVLKKYLPYVIAGIFIVYPLCIKKCKQPGALLLILLVYSAGVISSLINGVDLTLAFSSMKYPLVMYMLGVIFCQDEYGKKLFLRLNADMFLFLAAANVFFIEVLLKIHPEYFQLTEEWQETFLGIENLNDFILTIGMLYCLLDDHINGRSFRIWFYSILYAATIIILKCATFTVGGFIVIIYLVFPLFRKFMNNRSLFWVIIFEILFFILLVFLFDFFTSLPPVKWFVQKILHKDVSSGEIIFSGRVFIWRAVIAEIIQKPLSGYGMQGPRFIFVPESNGYRFSHNQYLQSWHEGGILGLIFPLVMLSASAVRLARCKDREYSGIFNTMLLSLLTMLQTDQQASLPWYTVCITVNLLFLTVPKKDDAPAIIREGNEK